MNPNRLNVSDADTAAATAAAVSIAAAGRADDCAIESSSSSDGAGVDGASDKKKEGREEEREKEVDDDEDDDEEEEEEGDDGDDDDDDDDDDDTAYESITVPLGPHNVTDEDEGDDGGEDYGTNAPFYAPGGYRHIRDHDEENDYDYDDDDDDDDANNDGDGDGDGGNLSPLEDAGVYREPPIGAAITFFRRRRRRHHDGCNGRGHDQRRRRRHQWSRPAAGAGDDGNGGGRSGGGMLVAGDGPCYTHLGGSNRPDYAALIEDDDDDDHDAHIEGEFRSSCVEGSGGYERGPDDAAGVSSSGGGGGGGRTEGEGGGGGEGGRTEGEGGRTEGEGREDEPLCPGSGNHRRSRPRRQQRQRQRQRLPLPNSPDARHLQQQSHRGRSHHAGNGRGYAHRRNRNHNHRRHHLQPGSSRLQSMTMMTTSTTSMDPGPGLDDPLGCFLMSVGRLWQQHAGSVRTLLDRHAEERHKRKAMEIEQEFYRDKGKDEIMMKDGTNDRDFAGTVVQGKNEEKVLSSKERVKGESAEGDGIGDGNSKGEKIRGKGTGKEEEDDYDDDDDDDEEKNEWVDVRNAARAGSVADAIRAAADTERLLPKQELSIRDIISGERRREGGGNDMAFGTRSGRGGKGGTIGRFWLGGGGEGRNNMRTTVIGIGGGVGGGIKWREGRGKDGNDVQSAEFLRKLWREDRSRWSSRVVELEKEISILRKRLCDAGIEEEEEKDDNDDDNDEREEEKEKRKASKSVVLVDVEKSSDDKGDSDGGDSDGGDGGGEGSSSGGGKRLDDNLLIDLGCSRGEKEETKETMTTPREGGSPLLLIDLSLRATAEENKEKPPNVQVKQDQERWRGDGGADIPPPPPSPPPPSTEETLVQDLASPHPTTTAAAEAAAAAASTTVATHNTDGMVSNLTSDQVMRYSRQLLLTNGFGVAGQKRLLESRVLVIGAGGIGSSLLLYLAAAGVGRIDVVDHDCVDVSNLHRQVIHTTAAAVGVPSNGGSGSIGDGDGGDSFGGGKSTTKTTTTMTGGGEAGITTTIRAIAGGKATNKAVSACRAMSALNPTIDCRAINEALTHSNALSLVCDVDLVVDATDNPRTRYLINDACVLAGKILISGSAMGTEGQLTVYNYYSPPVSSYGSDGSGANEVKDKDVANAASSSPSKLRSGCYRCLYPSVNPAEGCRSCSDNGVLGTVPGLIGILQATEAIKILTGCGSVVSDRLIMYDAMRCSFLSIKKPSRRKECAACGDDPTIRTMDDSARDTRLARGPSGVADEDEEEGGDGEAQGASRKKKGKKATISVVDFPPELSVTPIEYRNVRSSGKRHLLLDVRVPKQFEMCSLPGAVNLPLSEIFGEGENDERRNDGTVLDRIRGICADSVASGKGADDTGTGLNGDGAQNDNGDGDGVMVYCVCRRGVASAEAARILSEMLRLDRERSKERIPEILGVKNVEGGLNAWSDDVDPTFPRY